MNSFDVISLDLFNTLVCIDRSSFDLWSHMEKSLQEFPDLGHEIPLNDIITDYYGSIRLKMRERDTEREFRNDEILLEVLNNYIETSQDLTKLAHDIMTFYFESALPLIHLLPGVHKTLDYLKEKGYTLVLTSNHSWAQNGWDVLNKYDLIKRNYFDRITFSGDIGWRKPSKKIFTSSLSGLSAVCE